jgi:hypothetical protein
VVACAAAVACVGDGGSTGVDPDAIAPAELAAVRRTLDEAVPDDTLYATLGRLVLPFVDRASRVVDVSGDTVRIVGLELDVDVESGQGDIDAEFTLLLAWRGYRPATRTVDSVFFVLGAGQAPIDVQLGDTFAPEEPGSGTALLMHQATDSTVTLWQTGSGQLATSASSYGSPNTQTAGGLTLTLSRGTLAGSFTVTAADQVPGGATTIGTARNFAGGIRALRIVLRGTL